MNTIFRSEQPRPIHTDKLPVKVYWLIRSYGWDMRANRVVILDEPSANCVITLDAFKTEFMAWSEEVRRTESSKPTRIFAVNAWLVNPSRKSIAGVRMRPDKSFPMYTENGAVYKNTYQQPEHSDDGSGEHETFLEFLGRFLPNPIERNWFLDHMAHKLLKPEIPGSSVWFVADQPAGPLTGRYGTGRGLMFRVAHALYGEAYCKSEDFDILTGTSAQAVYTDWQANCVLVTVDEAQASPTAYRRGEKRSIYTALKNCMDPAPKRRSFKVKGGQAFDGMSYCTVWVATNHANAASIPANDRRVTVLTNGREMTPEEGAIMDEWIRGERNIAALAEYLRSSDLSKFNMFTPLKTAGKDEMAELSLNDVERELMAMAADDSLGLVFTKSFLEREIEAQINGEGERVGRDNSWQGQLAGAFDEHCVRVKTASGDRARIYINKRRYSLYAFRSRLREAEALSETGRRAHVAKWGSIDSIQTVLKGIEGGRSGPDSGPAT